jgi:hypothetical protein
MPTAPTSRAQALADLAVAQVRTLSPTEALHLAAVQLHEIALVQAPDGAPMPEPVAKAKRAAAAAERAIHEALAARVEIVSPGSLRVAGVTP